MKRIQAVLAAALVCALTATIPTVAGGEPGASGCMFADEQQPEQALELTSATTGGLAATVLSDHQLGRCFSSGAEIGYRQVPLQVEIVQRRGGPKGLETVSLEVTSLKCNGQNETCLPFSAPTGPGQQPACPVHLDRDWVQPEKTSAATTFALGDTLVATVQATKVVHSCAAGRANVYLFFEVVRERRTLRDGERLVTIGRFADGVVCALDGSNAMVGSCSRFDPAL
jgi:hypothetical protein